VRGSKFDRQRQSRKAMAQLTQRADLIVIECQQRREFARPLQHKGTGCRLSQRIRRPDVAGRQTEWTICAPLRRTDVDLHMRAIIDSQERLWRLYESAKQWPARTLTAEQDCQDLARREAEMEQHTSFSYALFDLGETELLGCVHIEPSVELEVGADIYWWVIDWLVDSPIEQALDSSVRAWIVADWPISPARYAWQPLKAGSCRSGQDDSA
jgi:hypothetical protein